MANRNCGRGRPAPSGRKATPRAARAASTEPEVRRWPHPVTPATEAAAVQEQMQDPVLHYVRCALSYQNQLLAEIKTLLEQLAADRTEEK